MHRKHESRKRLLFVRRTYGFGGVETILLDWLKRIDYGQYEALVSSPTDVFSRHIENAQLPAKFIHLSEEESIHIYGRYRPEEGVNDLVNKSFRYFFPIWLRFLWRLNPDAVIFLDGDFFTIPLACVMAAFLITRGNVSMTIHSPNKLIEPLRKESRAHFGIPGLGLWWYRQIWLPLFPWAFRGRFCKRVLTSNRSMRDKIVSFYGYPADRMGLVGHGVDVDRFKPNKAERTRFRKLRGIPDDAFLIASTSRLSHEKNVEWVVDAFESVASSNPSVWLVLTGEGPLKSQIEERIGRCRQRNRIKMLGQVPDVCPVLQAADAYVLASTFEGCPIALMEAMAVGLICLMSRIPGPDEMIEHGRDGFLIEPSREGFAKGMAAALALTLRQREEMAISARQKIIAGYELEKAVESAFDQLGIAMRQTAPHKELTVVLP